MLPLIKLRFFNKQPFDLCVRVLFKLQGGRFLRPDIFFLLLQRLRSLFYFAVFGTQGIIVSAALVLFLFFLPDLQPFCVQLEHFRLLQRMNILELSAENVPFILHVLDLLFQRLHLFFLFFGVLLQLRNFSSSAEEIVFIAESTA